MDIETRLELAVAVERGPVDDLCTKGAVAAAASHDGERHEERENPDANHGAKLPRAVWLSADDTIRRLGDGSERVFAYLGIRTQRSADMCNHCHLATPRGAHEVCHACAIAVRAEARRGIDAIEDFLGGWSELERWLDDED